MYQKCFCCDSEFATQEVIAEYDGQVKTVHVCYACGQYKPLRELLAMMFSIPANQIAGLIIGQRKLFKISAPAHARKAVTA
jgi:hypothetical protein